MGKAFDFTLYTNTKHTVIPICPPRQLCALGRNIYILTTYQHPFSSASEAAELFQRMIGLWTFTKAEVICLSRRPKLNLIKASSPNMG